MDFIQANRDGLHRPGVRPGGLRSARPRQGGRCLADAGGSLEHVGLWLPLTTITARRPIAATRHSSPRKPARPKPCRAISGAVRGRGPRALLE